MNSHLNPKYVRIWQWIQLHLHRSSSQLSLSLPNPELGSILLGRIRIQGIQHQRWAWWDRRYRRGRGRISWCLHEINGTCLQFLAVEHATFVGAAAEVYVLRAADVAGEF